MVNWQIKFVKEHPLAWRIIQILNISLSFVAIVFINAMWACTAVIITIGGLTILGVYTYMKLFK